MVSQSRKLDRIEIEALLPFYVNGTLGDEERELVREALANDEGLRDEAALLGRLRESIQADMPTHSPGDVVMARLKRSIATERRRRSPLHRHLSARHLLAAAIGAVALISIAYLASHSREPAYIQASGEEPGEVLTVVFRPDATEAQISEALRTHALVIVDGPTANGLYRLGITGVADVSATVAALRARSDLFEFVEDAQ